MFPFCSHEVKSACARGAPVFSAVRLRDRHALWMSGKEPAGNVAAFSEPDWPNEALQHSGDDVGRDLVFDEGDAVAQL